MTEACPNLAKSLVEAQKAAQAVAKDSKNSFHKYNYASAESMIEEARGRLVDAGLALMTLQAEVIQCVNQDKSANKNGNYTMTTLRTTYRLVHAASGESIDMVSETAIVPGDGRPQDKAEAAAKTTDLGYFLRNLLLLPREDSATAMDARDDRPKASKAEILSKIQAATKPEELLAARSAASEAGIETEPDVVAAYKAKLNDLKPAKK